ncbi:unnamed protein product [Rotaria sp. Silwood2]|nr:unnamed protein product [Rotaria sp. Silwood2]CAF4082345.1 unnamed protein product [Rotaria sp. Silwood2]
MHSYLTIVCPVGATIITFDDIPNADPVQGTIPAVYANLQWVDANYLNATARPTSGYRFVVVSGEYIAWNNVALTIQTLLTNNTITLHSCVMAAGWSDSVTLTVVGYRSATQLYTTSFSLNTYQQVVAMFQWPGVNKVVFTPSGSGYIDFGIDNLCVTF